MIPSLIFTNHSSLSTLADEIQQLLETKRACVVKAFPVESHHRTLTQMVQTLGQPLFEKRNIKGGMVYEVTPDEVNENPGHVDTFQAFSFHTDCAEFKQVPDYVVLFCETPAKDGGETLWVDLDEVLPELSFSTLLELQKPIYNFRMNRFPILWLNPATDRIQVRYQEILLAVTDELAEEIGLLKRSPEAIAACKEFEQKAKEKALCFKLNKGDCLILDNLHSLHGRRFFSGQRVLKRVRFYNSCR